MGPIGSRISCLGPHNRVQGCCVGILRHALAGVYVWGAGLQGPVTDPPFWRNKEKGALSLGYGAGDGPYPLPPSPEGASQSDSTKGVPRDTSGEVPARASTSNTSVIVFVLFSLSLSLTLSSFGACLVLD